MAALTPRVSGTDHATLALCVPDGRELVRLLANALDATVRERLDALRLVRDRKSTRLNSSHGYISYAVFCLKKKKKNKNPQLRETRTQTTNPGKLRRLRKIEKLETKTTNSTRHKLSTHTNLELEIFNARLNT